MPVSPLGNDSGTRGGILMSPAGKHQIMTHDEKVLMSKSLTRVPVTFREPPQTTKVASRLKTARTFSTNETEPSGAKTDRSLRIQGLSVKVVAGTTKDNPFKLDFYRSPRIDNSYRITIGGVKYNDKLKNFADLEAKRLSYIPGPNKYLKVSDWRENIPS